MTFRFRVYSVNGDDLPLVRDALVLVGIFLVVILLLVRFAALSEEFRHPLHRWRIEFAREHDRAPSRPSGAPFVLLSPVQVRPN